MNPAGKLFTVVFTGTAIFAGLFWITLVVIAAHFLSKVW